MRNEPSDPADRTPVRLAGAVLLVATVLVADAADAQRGSGGRRRAPVLAIEVGTVHPVSGPAIEDAIILIRGGRIAAVGARGTVEVPEDATRISHPDAHAYPGFVDAMSTAYCDRSVLQDGSTDAASEIADGLDPFHEPSRGLVQSGVTTAYVGTRSGSQWRGLGCVIRPREDGYRVFPDKRAAAAGLRMTAGPGASHPLQRHKQLAGYQRLFDGLEAYDKAFEEFDTKKKEYDEAFEKYLAYHRKKKEEQPSAEGEKTEGEGDGESGAGAERRRPPEAGEGERGRRGGAGGERGRRGGAGGERGGTGGERGGFRGRGGGSGGRRRPPEAGGTRPAAGATPGADAADGDKPPERPKYPREPKRDPVKEVLKKIKAGDLTLRIEAHRAEEIRAALQLARDAELKSVVIEGAAAGGVLAEHLADAGVPVILTEVSPPHRSPYVDEEWQHHAAAARLSEAGVPVAIASGGLLRARHLPSLAAEAAGNGMDPDAAVRAITLTPASLLGVHKQVGSLEPGKLADVVITSGPLLASDARILRVVAGGRTQYEAR